MVDIGVMLPTGVPGTSAATLKAWVAGIEDGPFTSLGVADRVKYANWDHLLTLAVAAARTERVRVMSLVTLPALRDRTTFAKQVATLTQLAPGRITLGVGPGARASDFEECGGDFATRGAVVDEHLDRLFALRGVGSGPDGEQQLGPPLGDLELLVGGASDRAIGRMLRYGHGYVGGGLRPEIFAFEAFAACQAWAGAGRPGRPRLVASTWFSRHMDSSDAVDPSLANRTRYLAQGGPPPPVISAFARGEEGIVDAVRAYRDQGADEVVFFPMDADLGQLTWLADVVADLPEVPRGEPHPDFSAVPGGPGGPGAPAGPPPAMAAVGG